MKAKKLLVGALALTVSMTTVYAAPKNPGFKPVTTQEHITKDIKIAKEKATEVVYNVLPKGTTHVETKLADDSLYYEAIFMYKNMEITGLVDSHTAEIVSIEAEDTTFVGLKVVNLFYKNPGYKPAVTVEKAQNQALTLLEDAKVLEDTELGEYNLLWAYRVVIGNKDTEMEVILDTETNAIKYVKAYPALEENQKFITEDEVKEIIKQQVPQGTIESLVLDRENRVYDVVVVDPTHKLTFEIDALTGKILDYTKTPIDTEKPEPGKILTEEQVIAIIRNHSAYKKVAITEIELDEDDNKLIYKVEGTDGKFEYEFEVDAYTGQILDVDKEKMDEEKPEAGKILTEEQVVEIIKRQSQYKKVTIIDMELDQDDDEAIYEVKGVDGKFEYEFEVDAYTGKILEVDKEKMDNDDDDDDKGKDKNHGNKHDQDDEEWDD